MYIKTLRTINVGPLEQVFIEFPFVNDNPNPVVFVGMNGAGKSTLLSNIVDALYEMAGKAYNNARQSVGNAKYQYYKAITPTEIHTSKAYMFSYIQFGDSSGDDKLPVNFEYVFKSGELAFNEFQAMVSNTVFGHKQWKDEGNIKYTNVKKEHANKIFSNNVICYFAPDRYEKPIWLGDKYYAGENLNRYEHPAVKMKWDGELENPVNVQNMTNENLQWLLDVIVDSRLDIPVKVPYGIIESSHSQHEALLWKRVLINVEKVMSEIVGSHIKFELNYRHTRGNRLNIKDINTKRTIIPTLDSLSTGQSALFNMFTTIIRYADHNNIMNGVQISNITGIVIIDEIELHLHSKLQSEVLPNLIKMFPKVQFIITSHSPLFLLGMREKFGDDGFSIFELPTGNRIYAEQFSEFENAYHYIAQTNKYRQEIENAIGQHLEKPLIVTEGATDWKHMKAAMNALKTMEENQEVFEGLEYEFLEYEPKNSDVDRKVKARMSGSEMASMCEKYSYIPQSRKVIFIADRDVEADVKKLEEDNGNVKKWGNNVYSFCLPVPEHRKATPNICIEHLYTDDEITREVEFSDGYKRRLFLGYEFDQDGYLTGERNLQCKHATCCGPNHINIIDGSGGKKVIEPFKNHNDLNFALPKMVFANYVLEGKEPFDKMDFSHFLPIFSTIKEILMSEDKTSECH